jgi:hypothetical protein
MVKRGKKGEQARIVDHGGMLRRDYYATSNFAKLLADDHSILEILKV